MTTRAEIIEAMAWALIENDTDTSDRGVCDEHYRERRDDAARALNAALPLIREAMAEAVRPTGEPGNPHSYNPWDDDSIDPSNIDEVVHAAVSEGWSAGDWHGRDRAAHIVAGWEPVPAAQEGEGDE